MTDETNATEPVVIDRRYKEIKTRRADAGPAGSFSIGRATVPQRPNPGRRNRTENSPAIHGWDSSDIHGKVP